MNLPLAKKKENTFTNLLLTLSYILGTVFFSKTLNLSLIKQRLQQIQSYDMRVLRPVAGYRRIAKRQKSTGIKQELYIFNFEEK
jgi:hypothetical protein